ncbi:MFS general substrate transporter [Laetiporus sulphureus 93-53]|uniref:MFS general substrate transporter n=1 Tax=Laetiporus sulphureus 93-53 TaxID=1314785 RepID=A0A165FNK6_9APHY|nr:MFS general substrate transporter [Laetiporus sulphureus 93-53]KZT09238.1 MFS general substrate transporter [Laetiporus sulphureus 93-53]
MADKESVEDPPDPPNIPPELDPHNWTKRRKWVNVGLVAAQAIVTPVCSTLLAVGALQVDEEMHVTSSYVSALPVALFVLGMGLGPLFLAPLSEIFGRKIIYITFFGIFALLNVGCALVHDIASLVILRFLTGLVGSAGSALGGGTIGDMFTREERGGAQAIYGFGPTFGPAIGGLIGGYIADRAGWRWQMWAIAITAGVTTMFSFFFLRETYAPYILARTQGKRYAPTTIGFYHSITRPIRMLLFAPIVTTMALYMALIYGILYLHIVTIPLLFGPTPLYGLFTYRWHDGNEGLAYLGAGSGCYISIFFCIVTLNRSYRWLCKKYDTQKPEFRMPAMQLGMLLVPGGLFMYGWAAQAQVYFLVPLIGACIFASGMMLTYVCIQTYLVDAFPQYAASAIAAIIVLRCIFGTILSIFGAKLYESLGYGWGMSLLAFISIAALPIPFLFWTFGERLRAHPFIA